MSEHEIEPAPGIPEPLPEGETILWQGAPSWNNLAAEAFHIKAVAVYFLALIAWNVTSSLRGGDDVLAFGKHLMMPIGLAIVALGLLALFALLISRTTIYTITSRRVILRCGIALPIVLNIPFKLIRSAGCNAGADGSGDIVLTVNDGERISYMLLWPHVRPWKLSRAQPMLRGLRNANATAGILAQALATASGQAVQPLRAPAPREVSRMNPTAAAA